MPRFRKLLSPGGRGDRASDDGDRSRSPSLVERLWLQRPSSQADRAPHSAEPSEPPLQLSATTVPTTSSPPVEYSLPTTALPTAPSPPEEDSPPGPPSVQARLWAKAYEELKSKEEKVVVRYEEILSAESTQESQGDWCRLEDVVRAGLEKTRKESEVYEGIHTAKDAISSVKGILATAARTTQEGAAAWGVICFGLEILANPVNEHVANRKGISYVMRRTDLYWAMADSYFLVGPASPSSGIHISQLEKAFVELYAKLLVYQMRSVIRYRRNVLSRLPRDFIKLDDWEGQLDDIHKAEGRFDTDCARYDASESRLILEGISARQQNQEDCACREDLFETNPLDDKARIEDLKGGLRPEVFSWVVKNAEFQQWKEDAQARLLWIKGDPGKGKTMLMCGIINKLNVELHGDKTRPLSFYFCEANDAARSSATSVLRGLICHLVDQNTALLRHVRREHERWGGKQFKDKNAWQVMKRILVSILNDEDLGEVTLAIDALDECRTDLPLLLGLIADKSILPRTKWVVSSRDWPRIGQALERVMGGRKLSLELNEDAIAKAVSTYIDIQVEELADRQGYDEGTRTAVQTYLDRNAHIPNSTFLWVALVCRELAEAQVWETEETLKKYPPGLDAAYERMMEHIRESTSADLYIQILATTFTAYRPLALCELPVLIDQLENYKDRVDTLSKIIGSCGSFLTVRAGSVYFVHQSAKDFLRGSDIMPPRGVEAVHHIIFSRSLGAILGDAAGPRGSGRRASWELRRDPYGLRKPGIPIEQVSTPDPDPIGPVRYSCAYWVDHLEDSHPPTSSEDLAEGGLVDRFLKQKFLYWVEALSLMHILAEGVLATRKLEGIAINAKAPIVDHARDGYRFVLYNREVIEAIPLQAYMSALAFCPLESRIGFAEELPQHYRPVSGVDETWGHCLHTLQCRSGEATTQEDSVASMASTANLLAATLYNGTVRIWNPETGICLQIIEIPRELYVTNGSMALSADDKLLAIGFRSTLDGIKLLVWDPSTGERLLTIEAENHDMDALVYLDDRHLAAIQKNLFTLWDSTTGECREVVQLFESPDSPEMNNVAAISPDGRAAAALPPTRTTSGDHCHRIGLWDANRDMYTLEGHGEMVKSLAFSPDGLRLVSASWTSIKLWDSASGACVGTLDTNLTRIAYISLTQDNRVLWFSAEGLNLWDLATDSSLEYPVAQVTKAQFLGNKRQIAVARLGVSFGGSTIMILDDFVFAQKRMRYDTRTETLRLYSSADGSVLVSKNLDRRGPRKLLHWDPKTGAYLRSIRTDAEMRVILENSRLSYIVRKLGDDGNGVIELYGLMTDEHLLTLPWSAGKPHITSETVSADGRNLILGLRTGALEIWDVAAKTCAGRIQCARTGGSWTTHISVACSQDGRMLLTAIETDFGRLVLEVWDLNTSSCVGTIEEFKGLAYRFSMAISMDGQLVAVILDRGGFSIAIWNVHKGERLLTIEGFTNDDSFMSFSTTGPLRLQTDLGVWNLPPALLRGKESSVSAHELEFHGYGVTADLAWIVKGTEKIIWIPYDYRGHIVVRRSRVVFGVAGRVVIFNLPADDVFAKDFGPSI